MKICFTADESNDLESVLSYHFGHCPYYVIVDVDGNVVENVRSIRNPMVNEHNPGDLPAFMKEQGINVIITGGMGSKAQQYFEGYEIKPVTGAHGRVKDVLEEYLHGKVSYGAAKAVEPCEHKKEENDKVEQLKKEVAALREQLAELKSTLKGVEEKLK
ncbi:MAG: NifB/NifX family molybdenum-iron cluster-binding protein [Caldisericota bacterium]|nr:NifB/NifX family molybdenum-iron cluster-binding protein [Caldisericota bacterium]